MHWPDLSVNRLARDAVARLTGEAQRLRVSVQRDARGVTLVDAGITVPGSIDAGL
jgi:methenyltetrahydromethanopterin cyclohydrolase